MVYFLFDLFFRSSGWGILSCPSIRLKLRYAKLQKIEMHRTGHVAHDPDDTSRSHSFSFVSLFFLKNCIKVVFAPPNSIDNLHSYLHHSAVFSFGYVFGPLVFLVPLLPLMWECSNIPLLFCTNYAVSCYSVWHIANHISGMIRTKRCAMCSAR